MPHIIHVGLEHLQTGVTFEFLSPTRSAIQIHAESPTCFKVTAPEPFTSVWQRATDTITLCSYPDEHWKPPAPETEAMIRARVERNNILQRVDSDRELRARLEETQNGH
jgi:hypothetical protein